MSDVPCAQAAVEAALNAERKALQEEVEQEIWDKAQEAMAVRLAFVYASY